VALCDTGECAGAVGALICVLLFAQLQNEEDIAYLRKSLNMDAPTESQAAAAFEELIHECLRLSWSTQMNFLVHNLAHN
jgi:hypothetical protein